MPPFQWGDTWTPHVHRRWTRQIRTRYNGYVPREAISTEVGKLKAGLRNSPAMPISKAWKASWASLGLGSSPDRAVGVDRPELKPLEKATAFDEGGSPPL
jgi:hypothetical protein